MAESKVFHALKKYFTANGDDVLIIHSHKFLDADNKGSNHEKDFVVYNLTKGNFFVDEKKLYLIPLEKSLLII